MGERGKKKKKINRSVCAPRLWPALSSSKRSFLDQKEGVSTTQSIVSVEGGGEIWAAKGCEFRQSGGGNLPRERRAVAKKVPRRKISQQRDEEKRIGFRNSEATRGEPLRKVYWRLKWTDDAGNAETSESIREKMILSVEGDNYVSKCRVVKVDKLNRARMRKTLGALSS